MRSLSVEVVLGVSPENTIKIPLVRSHSTRLLDHHPGPVSDIARLKSWSLLSCSMGRTAYECAHNSSDRQIGSGVTRRD